MIWSIFSCECWETVYSDPLLIFRSGLMLSCMISFYIFDINPLSNIWFANIFSHSVGCLFVSLIVTFAVQKVLAWCCPIFKCSLLLSLPKETDSHPTPCPPKIYIYIATLVQRAYCFCFIYTYLLPNFLKFSVKTNEVFCHLFEYFFSSTFLPFSSGTLMTRMLA